MKMEVPVDVQTLTLYALDMVKGEPNPVEIICGANKREIFALARANIQSFGKDTAIINVPAMLNSIQIKQAEEHVRTMFPEID